MRKARIAVLVSGGGTNLQALIDRRDENPFGELALVVSSNPGAFALERAKTAGIPSEIVPRRGKIPEVFDKDMHSVLQHHHIDLIALAGFLCILGPEVLRGWPGRILNVHPSLIPSFCGPGFYGLRVHEAALKAGVKVTGATVHLVTGDVDGGPILLQKAVEVLPGDTPEILQRRVMRQAEWELLPRAVEMLSRQITERGNDNVEQKGNHQRF